METARPPRSGAAYLLVLAAVAAGLLPHWPQFTPVFGAMLLGGARLRRRDALWYPLLLWLGCAALQAQWLYHSHLGWGMSWQVAAMGLMVLAGAGLRPRAGLTRLALAGTTGATGFFIASNLAVWIWSATYPHNWAGLGACYLAAVPFYGNSVFASLLFGTLLLAAHDAFARRAAALIGAGPGAPAARHPLGSRRLGGPGVPSRRSALIGAGPSPAAAGPRERRERRERL